MLISSKQLSTAHSLANFEVNLAVNGISLERVKTTKLLGTTISCKVTQ